MAAAREFISGKDLGYRYRVLKGTADNVEEVKFNHVLNSRRFSDLLRFWNDPNAWAFSNDGWDTPTGTYNCDAFTPREIIHG